LAFPDDIQACKQATQPDYAVQMSSVVVLALMLQNEPNINRDSKVKQ